MDSARPPQKMEIDEKKGRRRYRLNKKKFGTAIVVLMCAVAVLVVAVYIISNGESVTMALSAAAQAEGLPPVTNTNVIDVHAAGTDLAVVDSIDVNETTLSGRVIVIDPGHGGEDSGAIGVSGVYESDVNLKVAQYLQKALEAAGAEVIMTRTDKNAIADTKEKDMAKRRQIIRSSGSDIVVSVHMNSFTDESISGPVVLFMGGSELGERLAEAIQEELNDKLDPDTEGCARADNDLYILKSGNQPSVLMECGYLSNPKEEAKLRQDDYQRKIAEATCRGIVRYFASLEN